MSRFSLGLRTARSAIPSPLKSATNREVAWKPDPPCGLVRKVVAGWKVPSPLPGRMVTPVEGEARIRSSFPSPLKSPATWENVLPGSGMVLGA
jgi:hypothetical protein